MQDPVIQNRKISERKRPSQDRSQRTVDNILSSTIKLLKKSGDASISQLTTNHIAKEAGLSVGSLYQYFPNKEAILFRIFSGMLSDVRETLKSLKTPQYLSLPRDEFFDELLHRVKDAEADPKLVTALHHAMKTYPDLADADRKHADAIADDLAFFMRHFGSKWPAKKLHRLGLYIYYLNYGGWVYRDQVKPPIRETLKMEIGMFNFLIQQCFDD